MVLGTESTHIASSSSTPIHITEVEEGAASRRIRYYEYDFGSTWHRDVVSTSDLNHGLGQSEESISCISVSNNCLGTRQWPKPSTAQVQRKF